MKRACIASGVAVVVLAVFLGGLPNAPAPSGETAPSSAAGALVTDRQGTVPAADLMRRDAHPRSYARAATVRSHVAPVGRRAKESRSQIAFSSNRTGTAQIWVMNADGSNQTRLTHSHPMEDIQPAWSSDGTKIAFSRSVPAWYESANLLSSEIWMMDADGSNEKLLRPRRAR